MIDSPKLLSSKGLFVPEVVFVVILTVASIGSLALCTRNFMLATAQKRAHSAILLLRDQFYRQDVTTKSKTTLTAFDSAELKKNGLVDFPDSIQFKYLISIPVENGRLSLIGVSSSSGNMLYRWSDFLGRRRLQAIKLKSASHD